jgi:hypothetical protein
MSSHRSRSQPWREAVKVTRVSRSAGVSIFKAHNWVVQKKPPHVASWSKRPGYMPKADGRTLHHPTPGSLAMPADVADQWRGRDSQTLVLISDWTRPRPVIMFTTSWDESWAGMKRDTSPAGPAPWKMSPSRWLKKESVKCRPKSGISLLRAMSLVTLFLILANVPPFSSRTPLLWTSQKIAAWAQWPLANTVPPKQMTPSKK